MWWLYQAGLALALVVAGPFLLLARGRHYLPTLAGRFGGSSGERRTGSRRPLWIHAVSLGEANVAAALLRELPADLPILLTTITPTGQARARAAIAPLGERAAAAYLPFDLGFALRRFFVRHRPSALILVEGDLWPLLLREVSRRGLPTAVVNGRVSDRSFARLRRLRRLVRPLLLAPIGRFGVQSEIDRERLLALGVAPDRVSITGNLKFESPEPPPHPALAERLSRLAAGRPILVAGSTMPREDEAVLDAFAAAGGGEAALLVLAPRHPERFPAVATLSAARFPELVRRSGDDRERPAVFLLDSIGELAATYRQATAAFIGGTLVPTGGHNPLEAARFGVPVAVGPSMENFREMAEVFDRSHAWARVGSGAELGATWRAWLAEPAAARALGERGLELVAAHRGATRRTLELLTPLLAQAIEAPR